MRTVGRENPPAPANIAARATYVGYGALGPLDQPLARSWESRLEHGALGHLRTVMAAHPATRHLGNEAYRQHMLDYRLSPEETRHLRRAADLTHAARTLDDLAPASDALAAVVHSSGAMRTATALAIAARAEVPARPAEPPFNRSLLRGMVGSLDPISSAQAQEVPEDESRGRAGEFIDSLAEVKIAEFNSLLTTLREIDPNNPQLTYVTGPDYVPSNEAIADVNIALERAVIRRVLDKIAPGGNPIGRRGNGRDIRVMPGGLTDAEQMFEYLRKGGTVVSTSSYNGTLVRLLGGAGYVGLRPNTSSPGSPGVDIKVPGVEFRTIHY